MKQFMVDELRPTDFTKLKVHLDSICEPGSLDGIYWLPIATEVLSDTQITHTDCQPFYVAIDLEEDRLSVELLVRTKNRLKCTCIAYASETQCVWLVRRIDQMFKMLEIKT